MLGSFAWPMKKIKNWKWGNTWFYILILGTYFTSLVLGNITVPHLLFINGNVPIGVLLNVFFFGAGWGLVGIGLELD